MSDKERFGDAKDLDLALFVSVIPNDQLDLTRSPALSRRELEALVLSRKIDRH